MLMIQNSVAQGKKPSRAYAIIVRTQYTWSVATALTARGTFRIRKNCNFRLETRKAIPISKTMVQTVAMVIYVLPRPSRLNLKVMVYPLANTILLPTRG